MPITEPSVRTITSVDPCTGKVNRELPCASSDEVAAAVARARAAQPAWTATPISERLRVLSRFQRKLYEAADEVAVLIAQETGKPRVEALLTEVVVVLDAVDFYLREIPKFLRPERVPHANLAMKAKRAYLLREPHGVIGIISPWNYPFSTPASEMLAAIATGNTVAIKPSEFTPLTALKLKELLDSAGAPAGVVEIVVGDGTTGAALINATIDKLIFTGSVATGKKIAEAAAKKLLPVVLELGGKDPMIVLDDANLDIASSAAVWGAFMNAGQTCLSVERCYVNAKIFDAFVERCVEKTDRLKVGRSDDPNAELGPLISQNQLRIVESQVNDAVAHGASVLTGGKRLPELGPTFYAPTVLTGVTHAMRIMQEETFGPVLPIVPFANDAEAIALANDSEFGLAASVWTRDRRRGEALARRIQAGTVLVNDVITSFGICEAPHGGMKQSGIGRTHGKPGLEEMVRLKYVDSDLLPNLPKVWWYGYGADFAAQMRGFVGFMFGRKYSQRIAGGIRAAKAFTRTTKI